MNSGLTVTITLNSLLLIHGLFFFTLGTLVTLVATEWKREGLTMGEKE